jgi:hypothetical protein
MMQSRERKFSLRFHADAADQHDVISSCAQIVKQRRLPDARLAPKYQGAAAAGPDVGQQLTERRALPLTTPRDLVVVGVIDFPEYPRRLAPLRASLARDSC